MKWLEGICYVFDKLGRFVDPSDALVFTARLWPEEYFPSSVTAAKGLAVKITASYLPYSIQEDFVPPGMVLFRRLAHYLPSQLNHRKRGWKWAQSSPSCGTTFCKLLVWISSQIEAFNIVNWLVPTSIFWSIATAHMLWHLLLSSHTHTIVSALRKSAWNVCLGKS